MTASHFVIKNITKIKPGVFATRIELDGDGEPPQFGGGGREFPVDPHVQPGAHLRVPAARGVAVTS
jgi:hypothetical protein